MSTKGKYIEIADRLVVAKGKGQDPSSWAEGICMGD